MKSENGGVSWSTLLDESSTRVCRDVFNNVNTTTVCQSDAECSDGMLTIPELRSSAFPSRMPGGSMHIYDYSLFYLNLRQNALQRAAAYLEKR